MNVTCKIILAIVLLPAFMPLAHAAYIPFNTNVTGNIGVGTSAPQASFVVTNGNVGIGTWTAAGGNLIINGTGNVGIGSAWPGATLDVNGSVRLGGLISIPSSTTSPYTTITAAGGITVTKMLMRIEGNGGAVTVTASPQIAAGTDGQMVVLEGMSNTNTVTISNSTGLSLNGGVSFTLSAGYTITLVYDATQSQWNEITRSAN